MTDPEKEKFFMETEVFTGFDNVKMFTVTAAEASGEAVGHIMTEAIVYYKNFPGLITPFGLPIECFPKYEALLEKDSGLIPAVNIMLKGAVASSTAAQYKPIILAMLAFCRQTDGPFPYFTEADVLHFTAEMFMRKKPLGFFQALVPALALLESISGRPDTGLTRSVRDGVEAIQRDMASKKPAVKKATAFNFDTIDKLIAAEVLPWLKKPDGINVYHFRSIFRATVIYFTVCRFADFAKLTDKEFTDCGTHIKVVFLTRKNDQLGDNSVHVIPARTDVALCPVQLIRLYFCRFGLKFQGTGRTVNFRLCKQAGRWNATTGVLSRSNAVKHTRQLLSKHGFEASTYTEKSLKVGAVTSLLEAGEPLESVQVLGGWKSLQTPLHYRNTSESFKLKLAKRIPVASATPPD